MAPRVMVTSPVAGLIGESTRISAVSPASYSSASGISVTRSSSRRRFGTASPPPLTQRIISLRLARPTASTTSAERR